MRQPESVAAILTTDPMFANDADGNPIARDRTCECGMKFKQRLLSARWLTIAENAGAIELVAKQIPEFYVPVHCPKCESRDLAMQSRKDQYKQEPTQPFGGRP